MRSSDDAVLLVDLRDTPTEVGELRLFDILHNHRRLDSGRVLAVDDATALVDHYSIYQAMQRSRLGRKVVCVAVGSPASRAESEAIRATPVLNNDTALTLWVGDMDGVGWPNEPAHPTSMSGGRPQLGKSELRALLDVLLLPEVFDAVVGMSESMPGRMASPGQLVLAGQVGLDDLTRAMVTAVAAVAGRPDHERPAAVAGLEGYLSVIGTPGTEQSDVRRLRENSPMDVLHRRCVEQGRRAARSVGGLVGPLGPTFADHSTTVVAELREAGESLAEFRRSAEELFTSIDGRTGIDQARRDDLDQSGIVMDEPPDTDRLSITDQLQQQIVAGLDRGRSLATLAAWLRGLADQAVPAGSAGQLPLLRTACPDDLVRRLQRPPAFPWRSESWRVLTVAAVCCLLAGLGPLGPVTGPVLAIAWVAAVALAVARAPLAAGEPIPVDARRRALLTHLLAAGGGCALGLLLPPAVGLTVPTWLGGLAAAAAAAALAVVLRSWWVEAVLAWRTAIRAHQAAPAADAVRTELCRVAVEEWVLSNARRFTADAALAVSGAIDEVADALIESTHRPNTAERPPPRPSAVGMDLQRVVNTDLADLAKKALSSCWTRLGTGAVDDVRAGLRDNLEGLLDGYHLHLESRGIGEQPVFADATRQSDARAVLTRTLWQESPQINHLLHELTPTGRMVQLCSADDLPLLDLDTDHIRLIRFAPRAAQAVVTSARRTGPVLPEVVWTASGHLAGALRLVPLRDHAMTLMWPTDLETQDL